MTQPIDAVDIRWGDTQRLRLNPAAGAPTRDVQLSRHLIAVQDRAIPRIYTALVTINTDYPLDPNHQVESQTLVLFAGVGSFTQEIRIPIFPFAYAGQPAVSQSPLIPVSTLNGRVEIVTQTTSAGTENWSWDVTLTCAPLVGVPALERRGWGGGY